jgi:integral membrane sensor domain MASE1
MKTLLLVNLLVASVYVLVGKLGLALASVHPSATPVWPPTGIALAALLVCGPRVWPSVLAGAFVANQTTVGTAVTSGAIAVGNTLEGLLGAYLVTRFANGRHALDRSRDVFAFVALGALLSTPVSATVGVLSLALGGYADWPAAGPVWLTWWLGDVAGALIVAPAILAWSSARRTPWPRGRLGEAAAMLALLVFTGQVVFGRWRFWCSRGRWSSVAGMRSQPMITLLSSCPCRFSSGRRFASVSRPRPQRSSSSRCWRSSAPCGVPGPSPGTARMNHSCCCSASLPRSR